MIVLAYPSPSTTFSFAHAKIVLSFRVPHCAFSPTPYVHIYPNNGHPLTSIFVQLLAHTYGSSIFPFFVPSMFPDSESIKVTRIHHTFHIRTLHSTASTTARLNELHDTEIDERGGTTIPTELPYTSPSFSIHTRYHTHMHTPVTNSTPHAHYHEEKHMSCI